MDEISKQLVRREFLIVWIAFSYSYGFTIIRAEKDTKDVEKHGEMGCSDSEIV